jgi:mycothiol synthase
MYSSRFPISERAETVALVWPPDGNPPVSTTVAAHLPHFKLNRTWFDRVQAASGWQVTEEQWNQLLTELLPNSIVFAAKGKEPVAVACALAREDGWRELAWVAVASEHRGKRLGKLVCSALIQQLLASGDQHIFCSTQDERLSAIRIYLEIGFHPVHRADKIDRWRAICNKLDWPFTPRSWGWPREPD